MRAASIKSDVDDGHSSVNVELSKDEYNNLMRGNPLNKELLRNSPIKQNYNSTATIEEENDNDNIIKTMMTEFGSDKAIKTGTIFSSSLNLSNTVIGAGILGIPSAIKNTGWLLGGTLFIIFGSLAAFTMHLTMCVALCVEHSSYDALCNVTIPKLKKFADTAVGFACWGVCVAYLVVIGDAMDLAMIEFLGTTTLQIKNEKLYNVLIDRYFWMILYLILFILPTISLKKMDSLKFTSFFALFIFVVLMIMVILYWLVDDLDACHNYVDIDECHDGIIAIPETSKDWLSFFRSAPIFIFAYECHSNIWPIRNEMKMPTISRLNKVTINTAVFCTVIYAVVGYAGYLTYGENVESNILNNYPKTQIIGIVRVGLSFAITFSYPVANYPARECFCTLFFCQESTKVSNLIFYGLTYGMAIVSLFCAMILDDLGIVLEIIGSIGATSMVFILPGLFYYFLYDHPILISSQYHNIKRKLSVVMVFAGFILGVLGLVTVILEYV